MEAVSEYGLLGPTGTAARYASQKTETRPVESTLETQPARNQRPSVFVQTAAVAELIESSAAALEAHVNEAQVNTEPPEPTDAEARGGVDVYA